MIPPEKTLWKIKNSAEVTVTVGRRVDITAVEKVRYREMKVQKH